MLFSFMEIAYNPAERVGKLTLEPKNGQGYLACYRTVCIDDIYQTDIGCLRD